MARTTTSARCHSTVGCLACEANPRDPDPHGKLNDGCEPLPKGGTLHESLFAYVIDRELAGKASDVIELHPAKWQELLQETWNAPRDIVKLLPSTCAATRVSIMFAIAGRLREFVSSIDVPDNKVRTK